MKKITQVQKRVQNVRNYTYLVFVTTILFSYVKVDSDDNATITKQIITELCDLKEDNEIYMSSRGSNEVIISYFEQHLQDSIFIIKEKGMQAMAKHAGADTVKNDLPLIREIFTEANYRYIKRNINKSTWSENEVKQYQPCQVTLLTNDNFTVNNKQNLIITKPTFTKDGKYALVYYHFKSMLVLRVFEKKDNKWIARKFIPLGMS